MKHFFLIIIISIAAIQNNYAQHDKGGNYTDTIIIDKLQRTFFLHLPLGYSFIKKHSLPLVIFLHGGGGKGTSSAFESKFNLKANKEKFIVVYPNGYKKSWNDVRKGSKASLEEINDIKYISELLKKLKSDYKIDSRRIYLAGVSNGGFMAQTLACKLPNTFAATASVIASFPKKLLNDCNLNNSGGILYILGTKDPFVPFNGGIIKTKAGGEVFSANESINIWAEYNNCEKNFYTDKLPDLTEDKITVMKIYFKNCSAETEVILYKLINGGHQYPQGITIPTVGNKCTDINATDVIWNFFKRHKLNN